MIIAFLIIYGLFVLWGIHHRKTIFLGGGVISLQQSVSLKGILAIGIVLGHIHVYTGENFLLLPFEKALFSIVGAFFFLSGYGLLYSIKNKKQYINNFYKRVMDLLVTLLPVQILGSLLEKKLIEINWFMLELIIIYICFWIFFSLFSIKKATFIMVFIILINIVILYFIGFAKHWYVSTIGFAFGLLIQLYEKETIKIISKYRIRVWITSVILFLISCTGMILEEKGFIKIFILRNLATIMFSTFILLICSVTSFGNKANTFIGKCSFEIYLYGIILLAPLLTIYYKFGLNYFSFILVSSTICFGIFAYNLKHVIIHLIRGIS